MNNAPKKEKSFIIIRESVAESWARDASTLCLFVFLIGIGVVLKSDAMQWLGAIIGFFVVISRTFGMRNEMTKDQAIKFIQEMGE